MVKINYSALAFDHLVVFKSEETIFACGKENYSGRTRLFLFFNKTGLVYTRNGRAESWELLETCDASIIRHSIDESFRASVPVYQLKGASQPVIGAPSLG